MLGIFFAVQKQFEKRKSYYEEQYGIIPEFKAGLHMGTITVVEVGDVKRDIAFHGDTINTAARIQSICNDYNKSFLISEKITEYFDHEKKYKLESLGSIQLKGKVDQIKVFSISIL